MNSLDRIQFRGKTEVVKDTIIIKGRKYLVLERLSRRGAFRVFDRSAGPKGDYRVLYQLPLNRHTHQTVESLRRMTGPTANRNFPHIVDYCRRSNEIIVVISWTWGTSLRSLLPRFRSGELVKPSVFETVRLFRGLAHGIGQYHRHMTLVHGDVSPANLILTYRPQNLVLIDYGSAWPVELSAHKTDGDGFTIPYAAPERITRHAMEDFRSDQFSLAVVAYEMLTGEIPFDGAGSRVGTTNLKKGSTYHYDAHRSLSSQTSHLTSFTAGLLNELFAMSLAIHPDSRYATRKAWLNAWDELHRQLATKPRRIPFTTRLLKSVLSFLR